MKRGNLVHRTAPARVEVRPDVLPELVAWLAVWQVRTLRALRTLNEPEAGPLNEMKPQQLTHWQAMLKAIRYLSANSPQSMPEIEFELCLMEAKHLCERFRSLPRPRGGHKVRELDHVATLAVSSGAGGDGPGGVDALVPGAPPAPDGSDDRPRLRSRRGKGSDPQPAGPGEPADADLPTGAKRKGRSGRKRPRVG